MRKGIAWALLLVEWVPLAGAHTMTMTEVTVTFAEPGTLEVKVGIDLTQILGSPERYYELVTESAAAQKDDIRKVLPQVLDSLRLAIGSQPLQLDFQQFSTATADKTLIIDGSMSTLSTFRFVARLPVSTEPLKLIVPLAANIPYPALYPIPIPPPHPSLTPRPHTSLP